MIDKWLHAGVLERGSVTRPETGVPQWSGVAPVLAHVLLPTILDAWFDQVASPRLDGEATLYRFADDGAPRRREGVPMSCAPPSSHAAHKMRVGPSQPPCRRRLQTTSRCAGQEHAW